MDFLKSEKLAESHKNWASEIVYFVYFAYQVDEPRKNDSHAFDEEYNSRESLKKRISPSRLLNIYPSFYLFTIQAHTQYATIKSKFDLWATFSYFLRQELYYTQYYQKHPKKKMIIQARACHLIAASKKQEREEGFQCRGDALKLEARYYSLALHQSKLPNNLVENFFFMTLHFSFLPPQ